MRTSRTARVVARNRITRLQGDLGAATARLRNVLYPLIRLHAALREQYLRFVRPPLRVLFFLSGAVALGLFIYRLGFASIPGTGGLLNPIRPEAAIYILAVFFVIYELASLVFPRLGLRDHLRTRKLELAVAALVGVQLVFGPDLAQALTGRGFSADEAALALLFLTNATLLVSVLLRSLRLAQFTALLRVHPPAIFLVSFLFVILGGALLLAMPRSTAVPVRWIDHLFISVSATCVTGLTTIDISKAYTRTGQTIILALIQIGGLGLMTLTTFFAYFLSGAVSLRYGVMMKDLLSEDSFGRIKNVVAGVALYTFVIEAIGAVWLYFTLPASVGVAPNDRLFHAVFHSISAFCNAGFALYSSGLVIMRPEGHAYLGGIMFLIVLGGLGFPVLGELSRRTMERLRGDIRPGRFSVHTRVVLYTNAFLLVGGTGAFLILERGGTLADMTFFDSFYHSLFYSVAARTAGYNSVPIAGIGAPMVLLSLFLMWVGASPASTGGGIKTTALALSAIYVTQKLRGRERIELFRREISEASLFRAHATVFLSIVAIFVALFILTLTERAAFLDLAFETVSAFGTVGLSRDLTPLLSDAGKLTICLTMLAGRVGILTFFLAFTPPAPTIDYRFTSEKLYSSADTLDHENVVFYLDS